MMKFFSIFAACLILVGCADAPDVPAPVAAIGKPEIPSHATYRVKSGDTLYSIAWAYALDYRQLAAANNLVPPYSLRPGQIIQLRVGFAPVVSAAPLTSAPQSAKHGRVVGRAEPSANVFPARVDYWLSPARGRIVQGFNAGYGGNSGIDISGRFGSPVWASANGLVVYSGTGVRGYGNLIIIKHNDNYLSAYAFNERNQVRVGVWVKAGQQIALMGRNNAGRVLLHFEIRKNGQPVNPMLYLK